MREFGNDDMRIDYAEALTESHRLDVPSKDAKEALDYVTQFIYLAGNSAELIDGYMTEEQADRLVEIREANSSFDLNAGVNQLCVDGGTSQHVEASPSTLTFEASMQTQKDLRDVRREVSSESRKTLSTMSDLCTNVRDDRATVIVPEEVANEIRRVSTSILI